MSVRYVIFNQTWVEAPLQEGQRKHGFFYKREKVGEAESEEEKEKQIIALSSKGFLHLVVEKFEGGRCLGRC